MKTSQFILSSVVALMLPRIASAVETVKLCGRTEVQVSEIKLVERSAGLSISREQAEFKNMGYIVQRCQVDLQDYNIRGTALILFSKMSSEVSAFIYRE